MGYVLKAVLSSAQHPEYGRLRFHSLSPMRNMTA